MGVTWRMSTIALVFDKLFTVRSEAFATSTGKLVNLISNDVGRFDEWGVFAVYFWESYLEVLAIFLVLVYSIGIYPALAALGSSLLLMPLQVTL
jgi:ATP-binding cassette subfamily C (CFTR/MRP) protein 4